MPQIDTQAFARDVQALRHELMADLGPAELAHLRKMARWGRLCTVFGYLLAWLPNPISVLLLSLGNVARWTMVAHHVLHRGYDRIAETPPHFRSSHFASGWRRWIDWMDWIHPRAWVHEHNHLHHFHLGEYQDPDLVEHNSWILRRRWLPRPLKWLLIAILMMSWKLSYYAPNTWWAWRQQLRLRRVKQQGTDQPDLPGMADAWRLLYPGERVVVPVSARSWGFYLHCVLPYAVLRFGLIPALFLPLGTWAWAAVLLNTLLAELLANAHAFLIIAPNHAGADLYRFEGPAKDRGEFYLRQVLGSANYPGGSDLRDFLMGYLNYQIEHHVWPDLPMLKYRQAAPKLRALCARHGVPYVEESVFLRFRRLCSIMTGTASMRCVAVQTDHATATIVPATNVSTNAVVRSA